MFIEYIYIYIYIWTVQFQNGTAKHFETETFYSNWKNKTPTETELTTLFKTNLKQTIGVELYFEKNKERKKSELEVVIGYDINNKW
jgi:hypothetical protein